MLFKIHLHVFVRSVEPFNKCKLEVNFIKYQVLCKQNLSLKRIIS